MSSDHLLIASKNLSYGIILTHLFKHLKINLSNKRSAAPSIDNDRTLLKRMHVGFHAQAPPHPTSASTSPSVQYFTFGSSSSAIDPYADIRTQLSDLSLHITISSEKICLNQEALQSEQQNNMTYEWFSIRFLQ